ncbi:MAG: sulfatase [Planctomycetota bacterium]
MNVLLLLTDQLTSRALSMYAKGDATLAPTPNLDRLATEGVVIDDMCSTCPVCTPARAMLLTGRHPQTTGHVMNSVRLRHDEVTLADVFRDAGYRTGWIGKWHLHTGAFPAANVPDYVPVGRDRGGFEHWRGYNQHMIYWDGPLAGDDWDTIRWKGYETDGLGDFALDFLRADDDRPFLLCVSPHQPHDSTWSDLKQHAPDWAYEGLPNEANLVLPPNVAAFEEHETTRWGYREYLAMIRCVDAMVGRLLDELEALGKLDDTLFIFTSDHGNEGGARGGRFFEKRSPHEESISIPLILRHPALGSGRRSVLMGMPDMMPTLCCMCGLGVPATVEGVDCSAGWRGASAGQDALLLMRFSEAFDHLKTGAEWRGVRTPTHTYARWLTGERVLFDNAADPWQMNNLADTPLADELEATMQTLMAERGDALGPCTNYADWFDEQRRVVRNAWGPLPVSG